MAGHPDAVLVIAVADNATLAVLLDAVDADIDHRRTRLEPVALDEARLSDRRDQEIGPPAHRAEIAGPRMGDGDRGILLKQELRHRLADDVRPPDHHRL